jgi:hypothetical protein
MGELGSALFGFFFVLVPTVLSAVLPTAKWMRAFSRIPMGLTKRKRRRKKGKAHSILLLSSLPPLSPSASLLERYAASLPRSQRATISKQVPKSLVSHSITVTSSTSSDLTLEHYAVLMEHERQHYQNTPTTYLAALARFISARCMLGRIDSYYADGRLVAWTSSVVVGSTLRAQWFYQLPECKKYYLYFDSIRASLSRAEAMGLEVVDLGPVSPSTEATKEKFGFKSVPDWSELGGMRGGLVRDSAEVPAYTDLHLM